MNLPESIQNIFKKKTRVRDTFLSVILDSDSIGVGVWAVEDGKVIIDGSTAERVIQDSWDARAESVDKALSKIEDKTGNFNLQKAVLGLPAGYLTKDGDITKPVRKEIHQLMQALELVPIGFVPVHQALLYKLKRDEGVPPSAILLGITHATVSVSLYKVGVLSGQTMLEYTDRIVSGLEHFFKSLEDIEVLPSRMLLSGGDEKVLDNLRGELLRHPWPTKVNFLHFPKIEILTFGDVISAISFAGAKEMAKDLGIDEDMLEQPRVPEKYTLENADPKHTYEAADDTDEIKIISDIPGQEAEGEENIEEKDDEETEAITQDRASAIDKSSNVTLVEPERLGFHKDRDILTHPDESKQSKRPEIASRTFSDAEPDDRLSGKNKSATDKATRLRASFSDTSRNVIQFVQRVKIVPVLPVSITIVFAGLLYYLYLFFIPKASVTMYVIPKTLEDIRQVTVNPTATVADSATNIIPGHMIEKSVSGETTIPVTGKKKIGDPAKGSVTIYNKALTGKSFVKGAIFVSGTLSFTLDHDVSVASASENLAQGSTTYGKAAATLTASDIGAQGNIPGDSQLTVKGINDSVVVAINDNPFTGGASKDVTVVSRADYDALVSAMTKDLVGKAKSELGSMVSGGEKIIDSTLKTTVAEKKFTEELDQEATILHGKVTLNVSGLSYKDDDVRSLVEKTLSSAFPEGYEIVPEKITVMLDKAQAKKDGTIVFRAVTHMTALPKVNTDDIRRRLSGKTIASIRDDLSKTPGIGSVEFSFQLSPAKGKLPINRNNISVSIAIQE